MAKTFIALLFLASLPFTGAMAQSEWERPTTPINKEETDQKAKEQEKLEAKRARQEAKAARKAAKEASKQAGNDTQAATAHPALSPDMPDYKYLKEGAVPQDSEGKVVYTLDIDMAGASAQQVYDRAYQALDSIAREEQMVKGGIVLVNKKQHSIAGQYTEWLTFKSNFINLDRTKFNYTLIADCTDGHLHLTLQRISYAYEENRSTAMRTNAEEWIVDKYAVNKKGTKLLPGSAKFRRNTIDRVEAIFHTIKHFFQ